MAIYKNVASQKLAVYAVDANGIPVTGDAANITAQLSKDWGASAAITDTNPTQLDATNHPGTYLFDLSQTETNADILYITPVSSTSGVYLDTIEISTIGPASAWGQAIADAILIRDWTSVTGEAARSVLNALRFIRNKWSISGGTLTVTKEDDSTSAWTATVSTDAAADPVIGNDPA